MKNSFFEKKYFKKLFLDFSKYTIVGVITSLLQVLFVWLLIDVFNWNTFIGTSVVVMFLFILKFYFYILIKLITKQFLKYTLIQIISALLNIILIWFGIEILNINTVIATSIVVIFLFLLRFILFKKLKLIENKS